MHPFRSVYSWDKLLQQHLRKGGGVQDEVGFFLLEKIASSFLSIGVNLTKNPKRYRDTDYADSNLGMEIRYLLLHKEARGRISAAELAFIRLLREGVEQSGLSKDELIFALSISIQSLMPNPCVRTVDGDLEIVAATQMLISPLDSVCGLWIVTEFVIKKGGKSLSKSERQAVIQEVTVALANHIKQFHDNVLGPVRFTIESSGNGITMEQVNSDNSSSLLGCMLIVLMVIVLGGGFAVGIYYLFR